jgi:WD40 repeat protein
MDSSADLNPGRFEGRMGRLPHPMFVGSVAFDPAGRTLATDAADGKVRVWDLAVVWDMNPDRWKQQACTVVGRPLSREEWNELLADRRYRPACQ